MDREEVFKTELNYIRDEQIRNSTRVMIELLPDYFFHIPASSTGKYHPAYATGEYGLVRHVKAAVRIAHELFQIYDIDSKTKDLIIMALILHDGLKKGLYNEEYTRFDHPLLIGKYILENRDKLSLTDDEINRVVGMVESHMGKWNTSDYNPEIVLPLPDNAEKKLVHMCDFLASRKCLKLDFDGNLNVID